MDEIEMFASLCPPASSIDVLVRDELRAELFGDMEDVWRTADQRDGGPTSRQGSTERSQRLVLAEPRASRRVGRRSPLLAAASIAALLVGAVGVWLIATRNTESEQAAEPSGTAGLTADDLAPPRPVIDDPLWTLTGLGDDFFQAAIGAVFEQGSKFDGPVAVVETWSEPVELGPTATVPIGESDGTASSDASVAVVEWVDGQGNRLRLWGVKLGVDAVAAIARTISIHNGRAVFAELPSGLIAADAEVVDAIGRSVETRFTGPGTDMLDIRTYTGGSFANRQRVGIEDRTAIAVGEETFLVADFGGGRYRANTVRGFWAWEVDGSGFASADEFVAFLAMVRVVDEQRWQSTLPESIVRSGTEAAVVDALLADVPIPPNLDLDDVRASVRSQSRYQVIAAVSASIVCGWLDVWFDAETAGDQTRISEAAAALASSRNWAMLLEIVEQGEWPEVVWQWADAVNGGPGVASGAGPQPPTPNGARSALGCHR